MQMLFIFYKNKLSRRMVTKENSLFIYLKKKILPPEENISIKLFSESEFFVCLSLNHNEWKAGASETVQ